MRALQIQKDEDRFNFMLFFSGRSLSVLMTSIYSFASGLYILKMTGSGFSFAVTLSLQIIPTVVIGPFAGVLADRFEKKSAVVLTDGFNGILFIAWFFAGRSGITLFEIYAATLLLSISQTLYNVCIDSAVPNIVSEHNVLRLNSIDKIVDSAATMAGPALGGIFYAVMDLRFFILLNGISFLLSTVTECLIRFRPSSDSTPQNLKMDFKRDSREGLDYIRKTDWLKSTLINFLVINFFISFCYAVPVPYILNGMFHLTSKTYGIVQSFVPLGMILGALLVGKITSVISYARLRTMIGIIGSFCLILFGMLPAFHPHSGLYLVLFYYAILLTCFGLMVSLIDIPFINSIQLQVPENIRGRSLSISISAVKAFTPAGYLLSGALMKAVPAFCLPLCGGLLLLLFYAVIYIRRALASQHKA